MDFPSLLELIKQLWGLANKPLGYIYNLEDNVDSLQIAARDLEALSEDVKGRVEREEGGGDAHRTNQVANWLGKVQAFEVQADRVVESVRERHQSECLSRYLPQNCRTSYKLGKRADQLLNEARELQHQKGGFGDFTSPLPPPPLDLEIFTGNIVGLDNSLNEVWKWLMDENVGVIGLYGTGGVGKTSLMKMIKKKLSNANHRFELIIWVVVSRQVNEDRIRDAIRRGLKIEDENWDRWSRDERVHHLFEDLTRKKFVLLIDDVWERLDLSKIGVPNPDLENGSKLVFTTRSKQVCHQMQANKTLEVKCLTPKEALALFENNVGKSTVHSNPEITELAKDIVQECKGLPLAIITIGRAMASIENPREWKHALETLRKNPYKLSGMEKEVYHILELSYDRLDDSSLQSCFLYCCLFPEDYRIRTHELIGLWIGERLLRNSNDVYSSRNEGECFLGRLIRACLLETGNDVYGEYVKMHDVIHDMAIWISRDRGKNENKLLLIENGEDISEEMICKWQEANKVSLWGQWIENIDRTPPKRSRVETLFVRETQVVSLPRGFFESMKAHLMVLDLSDNKNMTSFPKEICKLINLRYLNISRTCIRELPRKIKKLTRLRWLLLDDIGDTFLVPIGAIASLPLNVFSYWWEKVATRISGIEKEEEILDELGRMQYLTEISIRVYESSSALKIFQSPNLRRRIRRAEIRNCVGLTNIEISGDSPRGGDSFLHLEELCLWMCKELRKIEIARGVGRATNSSCFPSLVIVSIGYCGDLEDLSWLVHAPNLRDLKVYNCLMERIIGDGYTSEELAASGLFSRLQTLRLEELPNLRSICDQTLSFPQRVTLRISDCPCLTQLPLDSNSASGRS